MGRFGGGKFYIVIPAKAGIHRGRFCKCWIPAFAGMTSKPFIARAGAFRFG